MLILAGCVNAIQYEGDGYPENRGPVEESPEVSVTDRRSGYIMGLCWV